VFPGLFACSYLLVFVVTDARDNSIGIPFYTSLIINMIKPIPPGTSVPDWDYLSINRKTGVCGRLS
jgi:hypothetical protein